jgi:16S rRNA (adenine1518-N6/adenine1519-N6)-dimethyltransferase
MPLYRWNELKAWLDSHDLFPKRGLSQNFLIDGNIVDKILSCVEETEHPIVEIGPGPGVLTEAFYARGKRLFLIEADTKLAPLLERFSPLEIHVGDALKIDPSLWLKTRVGDGPKATVISNLPYHLSTPFFKTWLMSGLWAKRLVIMVQKEFAERLVARPGDRAYCPLTVIASHYIESMSAFDVPPSCFYPAPKITSTVLCIDLKPQPAQASLLSVLEHLFNQRRRMISGIAKRKGWRPLEGEWKIYETQRPEQLEAKILWKLALFFNAFSK